MKTLFIFTFSIILLSGCHFLKYDTNSIYSLNIPSYPHANESIIFSEGDSVYFDQPVIEVKSFTVDLHPQMDEKKVTDTLQSISKEFGYDILAINSQKEIVWDENNTSFFEYMLAALADAALPYDYTTYTAKRLQVVGYKYLANVTYADQIVRSKKAYEITVSDSPEYIYEQTLLPSGQQQGLKGDERMFRRIHRFSEAYFLQTENDDWQYRWTEQGVLIRSDQFYKFRITFDQSKAGKVPLEVDMKSKSSTFEKYNISIFYNNDNQVISKAIMKDGKPYASFDYTYDDQNRVLKEEIFFNLIKRRYEVKYEYYNQAGLLKILSPTNLNKNRVYSDN